VLALALAFALQQVETKHRRLRRNTSTTIFTTRGYVCPVNTLDPDYIAPTQFSKMADGSDDFAYACVCVEFRFHLGHPHCLRLCLRLRR